MRYKEYRIQNTEYRMQRTEKMNQPRVILLELNELCPNLMDRFINEGHLPNFKRLRDQANCFITDTQCDTEYLEPWIQWVTLHTGLRYEEHQVYRLGQSQQLDQDSIWNITSRKGMKNWICGSMNVRIDHNDENTWVLPDPWTLDTEPNPKELMPFYKFVCSNVQEHTNEGFKLSLGDYGKFLFFMLKNGLSIKAIVKIITQLTKQVVKAPDRWKKAMLLDALQWDVFKHVYKKNKPDLATFFSNSTAHFQHKYWRYMEPDKFSLEIDPKEIKKFQGAVLYGYKNHDEIVGQALDLADKNTVIILATALSQQPFLAKEEEGGKRFHRPHEIQKIPDIFGLQGIVQVSPVMSHQFHLICESKVSADIAEDVLQNLMVDDEKLFMVNREGDSLFVGCLISRPLLGNEKILVKNEVLLFSDIFYLADNLKSGGHHPHGIFWVSKLGRPYCKFEDILPLENTTSLILKELGIDDEINKIVKVA